MYGLEVGEKFSCYKSEIVIENNQIKMLLDFRYLNRLHSWGHQATHHCLLVDKTVSGDCNIMIKEVHKLKKKYSNPWIEVARIWDVQTFIILRIIRALGSISSNLKFYIEKIWISPNKVYYRFRSWLILALQLFCIRCILSEVERLNGEYP